MVLPVLGANLFLPQNRPWTGTRVTKQEFLLVGGVYVYGSALTIFHDVLLFDNSEISLVNQNCC